MQLPTPAGYWLALLLYRRQTLIPSHADHILPSQDMNLSYTLRKADMNLRQCTRSLAFLSPQPGPSSIKVMKKPLDTHDHPPAAFCTHLICTHLIYTHLIRSVHTSACARMIGGQESAERRRRKRVLGVIEALLSHLPQLSISLDADT